jgi:coenzyme F420-reducing hydrogenase gamma subunit
MVRNMRQNPHFPENANYKGQQRIIRPGTCTRQVNTGIYVPGCPPHPWHIDDYLEGRGFEKE